MNTEHLDPFIQKFINQSTIDKAEIHIRLEKKEFSYSSLPVSNDKNSARLAKFKEEMNDFFISFPHSKITNYLSNLSVIEVTVDIRDMKLILQSKKIAGIQMFESSAKYFN